MSGKNKRVMSYCHSFSGLCIQIPNRLCTKLADYQNVFKITLHKMINITTGSVANASNHLQPSGGMMRSDTTTINVDPSAQKN